MTDRWFHHDAASASPGRPRRFRSLASRLVALGVVQLVLLALTAVIVFIAEGPHEEADPEDKLTPAVVANLERLVDTPSELSDALEALRDDRIELSLYDETHQLIASNVDPPLAIPSWPPRRHRAPPPDVGGPDRPRDPDDRNDRGRPPRPGDPPDEDGDQAQEPEQRRTLERDPDQTPKPDQAPGPALDQKPAPDQNPAPDPRPRPEPRPRPRQDQGPRPELDQMPDARTDPRSPGERSFGPFGPFGPGGPPPPGGRRPPPRHRVILAFHPHGVRGLLVARGTHGGPPGLTGPLLVLAGGLLILVVGALITARWIVRPVERLSRTARALGSGDLQARSRLDRADEIGELGHRFDEMAERISSLLVTEKELLANVAHELRTPLTRIGVALDLANEGDAEAARASLTEIAVDVSELETIVDDILTAMRFEIAPGKGPAQLPLRRATIPANEIAAAAADRLRARHSTRRLEVITPDDLPEIDVDPVLFRRVIDNLLENAHKYTPDHDSPIDLEVARDGDSVVFEIRDRGVGISPEDLPRIFTAFFRGERSRSRETGGVGLGLTLSRRIVEAHGGTIDVTSTPNVGTSVRVTIPTCPT